MGHALNTCNVNVISRSKLIEKAPELPLWCLPAVDSKGFDIALKKLLKACERKDRNRSKTYTATAQTVLTSLMSALTPFYRYSSSGSIPLDKLLTHDDINKTRLLKIIEAATSLGWVKPVDYLKEINPIIDGKAQSRIEITKTCPRLSDDDVVKISLASISFIKKTTDRKKTGTSEFHYTKNQQDADQKLLHQYNKLVHTTDFKLGGQKVFMPLIVRRGFKLAKNDSLLNGRFSGGFWQALDSDKRSTVTINGQKTVEHDYSSMYLSAAYHLCGLTSPDNPYTLTGLSRDEMKTLTSSCFNISKARRKSTLIKILSDKRKVESVDVEKDIANFIKHIDSAHKAIKDILFLPKVGAKLMWMESIITRNIINHFTKQNIVILPIHDSYVIDKKHEVELLEQMNKRYETLFDTKPKIKKAF